MPGRFCFIQQLTQHGPGVVCHISTAFLTQNCRKCPQLLSRQSRIQTDGIMAFQLAGDTGNCSQKRNGGQLPRLSAQGVTLENITKQVRFKELVNCRRKGK